jgi:hypothetical protein
MDFNTSSAGKNKVKRVENAIENQTCAQLGCCGAEYIDDTSVGTSHTGPYMALQSVGTVDAVLDQSDMAGGVNYDDFDADLTIPNGATIFGKFTGVSLASGAIIAYKQC